MEKHTVYRRMFEKIAGSSEILLESDFSRNECSFSRFTGSSRVK